MMSPLGLSFIPVDQKKQMGKRGLLAENLVDILIKCQYIIFLSH